VKGGKRVREGGKEEGLEGEREREDWGGGRKNGGRESRITLSPCSVYIDT